MFRMFSELDAGVVGGSRDSRKRRGGSGDLQRGCRRTAPLPAVALVLTLLQAAVPAHASQVRLDVSMANPILLANSKQTTFIKVGLTGFKLDASKERVPVNVAIVLDRSGSMSGDKITKAKEAAIAAIQRLSSRDIVSVVAYDSNVEVIVPATKLTDKQSVIERVRQIGAGGSTALFAGVSQGSAEVRKFLDGDRVNRIILLSDGLANVGPKSPSELGELGTSLLKEGIAVSTMGLGLGYNEDLMTQLAQKSGGNHVFIEEADELVQIFNYEFDDVLSVVAQEVVIDLTAAAGIRPVRVLNRDAEITGQRVVIKMNQLYSEQEKYVLVEVEVPQTKAGTSREIATVQVSYANLQTSTTDRLSSLVSANFSDSLADVQQNTNVAVATACVLLVANEKNELATRLRDSGQVAEAKRVLLSNSQYLAEQAVKLNSPVLQSRGAANRDQAQNVDGPMWTRYRKLMRQQQYSDLNQQSFDGTKVSPR